MYCKKCGTYNSNNNLICKKCNDYLVNQYLNDKGRLYLIHTISRLDEIIILGNKYNLNIKEIQLIKTSSKNNPSLVIVKALKNSKAGVVVNNIINIENCKTYKNIFKK